MALLEDGAVTVGKAIGWSDIGNGLGIINRQRGFRWECLFLECAVAAFNLTIALRIMRRGEDFRCLEMADKGLAVLYHERGAFACDDARAKAGICFVGPL